MKKLLSFVLVVLYLGSCTSPDEILDDFQVHISPNFYTYAINVAVEDISAPGVPLEGNFNIEVAGKDADAIYNIDGTREYAINNGFIQLMVPNDKSPVEGSPLEFRLIIRGDGFQEASVPMLVEAGAELIFEEVQLLNLNNLPNSVSNASATKGIDPNTNTLSEPLTISTGTADSTSRIRLVIPTDVKFLDENGNEIVARNHGGQLNVNILSFSDTSQTAQQSLPNGGGMAQPVEVDGQTEQVLFDASATFQINMDVGGVPVRSFSGGKTSGGVSARIPIPAHMYNVEEDRPYQVGDSLSMVSFSDGDNTWQNDGRTFVVKADATTGELYAEPTIQHLSWWRWWYRWYWWRWFRPQPNRYAFTGHLKDANGASQSGSMYYRVRISRSAWSWGGYWSWVRVSGNFTDQGSFRNPRRFWTSYSYRITNTPFVFWNSFGSNFDLNTTSYNVGSRTYYDTEIAAKSIPPRVGFRLKCEGANALLTPPSGVVLRYKPAGSPESEYLKSSSILYTFSGGNTGSNELVPMPKLQDGQRYDFRAYYGVYTADEFNILVEDGKIYEVVLPTAACNVIFP